MSLSQKIAAAVDEVMESPEPAAHISAGEGAFTIDMRGTLATAVGVACMAFDFSAADADRSIDDLKAWGNRLAKRVTYLMEPLAVQEADPVSGEVLLRSQAPTIRNGRRTFYEVLLAGNALKIRRATFDEATRVSLKIPCQFTRETLDRLVDDLVATA